MKKITLSNKDLDQLVTSELKELPEGVDAQLGKELRKNIQDAFWKSLTIALDGENSRGFALEDIYLYTEIKRLIANREYDADGEFVQVSEADVKTLYNHFKDYKGWNPKAASIIILMDKTLKELV